MKRFKVTVDGQIYDVLVEEIMETPGYPKEGRVEQQSVRNPETETGRRGVAPAPPVQQEKVQQEKPAVPDGDGAKVPAPLPGTIIEVKVKEGDRINAGDVIVIIEAMKMENEITAPQGGLVTRVLVKKGETVNSGDTLVVLN